MEVRIKYLQNARKLKKFDKGDWIDLYSYENLLLGKDNWGVLSLGVAMELPYGYEAELKPRSSTFKTWGLLQSNSSGIIDWSFSGNNDIWFWPYFATRDTVIKKDDKICQFRIRKNQPKFEFVEVKSLESINRGGYGSSGKI